MLTVASVLYRYVGFEGNGEMAELETFIGNLRGEKVLFVLAGGVRGSIITLQIGAKVQRQHLVSSPTTSKEAQRFQGSIGVHIGCSWRLDDGQAILCTSTSSDGNDGPMVVNLKKLEGVMIVDAQIAPLSHDLTLEFANGYTLTVFCDSVDDDEDNYSVDVEEATVVVAALGIVRHEGTSPEPPLRVI